MYKIIGVDGQQYGPVPLAEIKNWVRNRRANGDTMVQGPDLGQWKPMKEFPEFADVLMEPVAAQEFLGGQSGVMAQPPVPDYLVQAIICTLCCCLPLGIVAIVYASQVKSKLAVGDYAGAQDSSNKAKMWCWIAFGLGIVTNLALIGLQLALGLAA
jgi:hypothetical protein